MQKLFGIPMGPLATVLAIALAVVVAAVTALALRNRVFFKLGVRNVGRRRGRTALIVTGLMLGTTIIASALATGDTMSNTIRLSAIQSLGSTDELISVRGANVETQVPLGDATGVDYFSEDVVPLITHELLRSRHFDGVAPAIVEPVAVQNLTARQNEPRVTLFASTSPSLQAFGDIRTERGLVVTLDDLRPGEVYLNADAADDLEQSRDDAAHHVALPRRQRHITRFKCSRHRRVPARQRAAGDGVADRRQQMASSAAALRRVRTRRPSSRARSRARRRGWSRK